MFEKVFALGVSLFALVGAAHAGCSVTDNNCIPTVGLPPASVPLEDGGMLALAVAGIGIAIAVARSKRK